MKVTFITNMSENLFIISGENASKYMKSSDYLYVAYCVVQQFSLKFVPFHLFDENVFFFISDLISEIAIFYYMTIVFDNFQRKSYKQQIKTDPSNVADFEFDTVFNWI